MITNDDRIQTSLQLTQDFVVGESRPGGSFWRDRFTDQRVFGVQWSGALLISDQWQVGASFGMENRINQDLSGTDLRDVQLNIAWEPFPIYVYSPWRPHLHVYAVSRLPVGDSAYQTQNFELGSFGRGFFSAGGGVVLSKQLLRWDFLMNSELLHSFAREFRGQKITPGLMWNSTGSVGYQLSNWRFGTTIGAEFEEGRKFEASGTKSSYSLVWNTGADISYQLAEFLVVNLSYNDQSLLGPTQNALLNRSVGLAFRTRQAR